MKDEAPAAAALVSDSTLRNIIKTSMEDRGLRALVEDLSDHNVCPLCKLWQARINLCHELKQRAHRQQQQAPTTTTTTTAAAATPAPTATTATPTTATLAPTTAATPAATPLGRPRRQPPLRPPRRQPHQHPHRQKRRHHCQIYPTTYSSSLPKTPTNTYKYRQQSSTFSASKNDYLPSLRAPLPTSLPGAAGR